VSDENKGTPSLLENESRGGEIAQGGFTFQDGVLLASIPEWLAHDGFAAVIRESVGDTEVKFFAPGRGELLHLIEAKNHRVTPAEFWKEVQRFRDIDDGGKGQFCLFTLACTGLSDEVEAVVNALNRVRGPISFYGTASAVVQNSVEDFTALVVSHGRSADDARFLLDKVNGDALVFHYGGKFVRCQRWLQIKWTYSPYFALYLVPKLVLAMLLQIGGIHQRHVEIKYRCGHERPRSVLFLFGTATWVADWFASRRLHPPRGCSMPNVRNGGNKPDGSAWAFRPSSACSLALL